jgi:hypothetical protein
MEPTSDPHVFIEEQREGYVRYVNDEGKRWEVLGRCDHRGNCLLGAVIDGEEVKTLERAGELARAYAGPDIPVGPGFSGCCPLEVTEL